MTSPETPYPEFSFPPNEHFDDEWNASLAFAWTLEKSGNIPELFRFKKSISSYHEKVHRLGPDYFEQSQRLKELTALVFIACNNA